MNIKFIKSLTTLIYTINSFILLLDKEDKRKSLIIFFFILIGTFLEMLSLGLLFPIIQLILNDNFISDQLFILNIKNYFNLSENAFIIFTLLFLIFVFLIKNVILVFIIIVRAKFIEDLRKKTSKQLYLKYLNQNFTFFINRNSSELIRNLHQEIPKLIQGIDGILIFFTEILILIGMSLVLLYISPYTTIIIILSIIFLLIFYLTITKKKIFNLGKNDQILYSNILKETQQGFGNFKEIFIYSLKDTFLFQFTEILIKYCKNNRILSIFQQLPRIIFEQFGIFLIIGISIFIFSQEVDKTKALAIIGVYAYAFFRLLPSINKIIVNIQLFIFVKPSSDIINKELNLNINLISKLANDEKIKFQKEIELKDINYNVDSKNKTILENINLKINKNSKIGIVGETGSGKSTLLNIIMGLLEPTSGSIIIDGKNIISHSVNWRKKISFVSQSTYLLDDSILNNITFNQKTSEIDKKKLEEAINLACLKDFIESQKLKLDTVVGERGARISGGELQRICIARAIYNDTDIFVLDEFTSSLDEKTEKIITKNIFSLDKTIISASHRLPSLKYCEEVYEIINHKLKVKSK